MNTNQVAAVLIKAYGEFAGVKRNPSGTPNGNAVNAIWKRTCKALMEAGETKATAQPMVYDLYHTIFPA